MGTCAGCKFWIKLAADPMNLGQPAMGECHCLPPGQVVLPSPQGLVISARYPVTGEKFPACGQYTPALEAVASE